jgi:hypothetical protein
VRLLLRLAGAFLGALFLALAALHSADAFVPLPAVAWVALAVALVNGSALWLEWQAARDEGRQGWRDWPEYRAALKKDEARRKAIRSQRQ